MVQFKLLNTITSLNQPLNGESAAFNCQHYEGSNLTDTKIQYKSSFLSQFQSTTISMSEILCTYRQSQLEFKTRKLRTKIV